LAGGGYDSDEEHSDESSESNETPGYAQLDDRFNKDIDDPTSFAGGHQGTGTSENTTGSDEAFITRLSSILQSAEPAEFMTMGEAALGENRLFVHFNRALAIRLNRPDAFHAPSFEQAVQEEFAARYIVRGAPARLDWEGSNQIHSLGQTLLDRGGAYALQGSYLLLANRKDYGQRILQAYTASAAPAQPQPASLHRFARVRVKQGTDVYRHVMSMLATPSATDDSATSVDLFSRNIAGLIDVVPGWTDVTIETVQVAPFLREAVTYNFEPPPPTRPRKKTK
jgi:hypothetical protein